MEQELREQLGKCVVQIAALNKKIESGALQSGSSVVNTNISNIDNSDNSVKTTVQNTQNIIAIIPWDGGRCLSFGTKDVMDVFASSEYLREYLTLGDRGQSDPKIAPPYVSKLFISLAKKAHSDPAARNVYLNPRRADQVLTLMSSGKWEIQPVVDATRQIMDGIAKRLFELSCITDKETKLPFREQAAVSIASLAYKEQPELYAQHVKGQMIAHFANMAPDAGAKVVAAEPLPASVPSYVPPKPPRSPPPAPRRWATEDAREQLAENWQRPGESLKAWADRLIAAAGVDPERWCNKLWEALDDKLIPEAQRGRVASLLAAAEGVDAVCVQADPLPED